MNRRGFLFAISSGVVGGFTGGFLYTRLRKWHKPPVDMKFDNGFWIPKFNNSPLEICNRIKRLVGTRKHKIEYIAISTNMPKDYLAKHTCNPENWDCRVLVSMPTRPDGGAYFFLPTECVEAASQGVRLYNERYKC